MDNQYTIAQISAKCKVSKQSLYKFINKNKTFIDENSTRNHRVVYYNQAAMDFFLAYYQPDEKTESGKIPVSDTDTDTDKKEPVFSMNTDRAEGQTEKSPVEAQKADEPPEGQLNALQRKIDALEAEREVLRKRLDATEAERLELLRQNGALILTISQLQQEKQLLLPAPRKSFVDRLKAIFNGK